MQRKQTWCMTEHRNMRHRKGSIKNNSMNEIEIQIKRSSRRTLSLQITREGQVVVHCSFSTTKEQIQMFVDEHRQWIGENLEKVKRRLTKRPVMTSEQVWKAKALARMTLSAKVRFWAAKMGVTYGTISIRQQATRWGSCSSRGNLNFNWTLILTPEPLQDYVVVHELAHRLEMNHSDRFWKIVESQIPDYKERRNLLKTYENQVTVME